MANLTLGVAIKIIKDQLTQWLDSSIAKIQAFGQSGEKAAQGGATATDQWRAKLQKLTEDVTYAGNRMGKSVSDGAQEGSRGVDKLTKSAKGATDQMAAVNSAMAKLAGLLGAGFTAKGVIDAADEMRNLAARLQVATGSAQGSVQAMGEVREIANLAGASIESVAELYARLARSTKDLGASQAEVAQVTDIITKALAASGEAGASAEAAIIQLGQAFASGTLRGDELRSVLEQVPRLAKAIADGLGVPIGQLRKLGEQGLLTSEQVFRAIQSQGAAIEAEFGVLPNTVGRAVNRVANEWKVFVSELDKSTGLTNAAATALNGLSKSLDELGSLAETAGVLFAGNLLVKAIPAVKAFALEMQVAAIQAKGLSYAVAKIPTTVQIAVVLAGAEIAKRTVEGLARSVAAWVENSDEAAAAADRTRERWKDLAVQANQTAVAFEEFASVQIKTADEVAALTDEQAVQYKAALDGARQYQLAIYQNAIAWEGLGRNTKVAQEKALQASQSLKAAMKEYEVGVATAANATRNLISLDAQKLINQFDALRLKGKSLAEALKELAESFNPQSLNNVQAFGQALSELSARGILTSREMREQWEKALGSLDPSRLLEFQAVAGAAFTDVTHGAEQLTAVTEVLARRAFAELGIDADRALTGVSDKAQEAIASVDLLTDAAGDLAARGVDVGKALTEAFEAATKAADSQQAVDGLRQRVEALVEAEKVGAEQGKKLLAGLDEQLAAITPGIQSAKEAYEALGVTSQEALRKTADSAKEAYEALIRLGAPLADQKAAFLAYAEAAIKANGGVASAAIRAKASALGLAAAVAELVGKQEQSRNATEAMQTAWEQSSRAAERSTEAVRQQGIAMVAAAQQALENAKAQGDLLAVEEATVQVREAEAKAARDLADALAVEAAAAQANVQALREKALVDGQIVEAEQQVIDAALKAADALRQQADAAKQAADKAQAAATAATAKRDEIRTVSIQWEQLAAKYGIASGQAGELAAAQAKVWAGMQRINSTGFGSLKGYTDAMNAATERAAAFVRAMGNVESAARGGDASLGDYIRSLQNAIRLGAVMGKEEIRPLRDALRDARQRMRDLSDSARDTLNSLRDELDEMNKNYDEIEKRRYAARRAEIEAQIAIAKSAGNQQAVTDLTRALSLLRQVSAERVKEAAAREREDTRTNLNKGSTTTGTAAAAAPDRVVTKVVDVNITVGSQTGTVQTIEGSEEVLVDMLRKAQAVAN